VVGISCLGNANPGRKILWTICRISVRPFDQIVKAGNSARPKTVTGEIMPQYLVVIHHPDDYDPSVEEATTLSVSGTWSNQVKLCMTAMLAPDQSFDFTPGHKRTAGYWSHRQCGAQIVSNLISAERRLKLF
jgi:hypothetical protein